MKKIRTEIEIDAPPVRVWQVLVDFRSYQHWNPSISEIKGEPAVGTKLEIRLLTSKGKTRIYRPTVTKVDQNRELRWAGRAFLPGIFDGERIFTLEQTGPMHTHLVHTEVFTGLVASLGGGGMDEDIRKSLEKMNEALMKESINKKL